MGQDGAQDATDLRFVIAVRDRAHLDVALRNLRRTAVGAARRKSLRPFTSASRGIVHARHLDFGHTGRRHQVDSTSPTRAFSKVRAMAPPR
jgi:hypothetical protein